VVTDELVGVMGSEIKASKRLPKWRTIMTTCVLLGLQDVEEGKGEVAKAKAKAVKEEATQTEAVKEAE